ncbi:MAG: S8 family serine peptidase [Verrucomicrobiae bacterium]|nr:S8 family serine peptidase [Verrucomicrobiae bacterium]MCP5550164.1 S8 family serine peptidase [Akkermansiaceae bacterium]
METAIVEDRPAAGLRDAVENATGRGARVGLLDTGVQSGVPGWSCPARAHYEVEPRGRGFVVVEKNAGVDRVGHGTACADILATHAPGAELHSVRVLGESHRDLAAKLVAGFAFAVERGWEIIAIGAGTASIAARDELFAIAGEAERRGLLAIAACDNRAERADFPAGLPNVVGVEMGWFARPLAFRFRPEATVEAEALGVYVEAMRPDGRRAFHTGNSFACPHLAAVAARLRERVAGMDAVAFREALALLGA